MSNRRPIPHSYKVVFKVLELRQKRATDSHHGLLKMQGRDSQVIPAGRTVVVEGLALASGIQGERSVIIEYPSSSPLPGGLLVKAGLVDFPQLKPYKIPVVISNESDHDIVIPAKCTLAEISAYQSVLLKEHSVVKQKGPTEPLQRPPESQTSQEASISFNFGESPVPSEWKERITQQLNNMPDVFAQHDLDFGKTEKVKHHITLSDGTPFKQRARPIHPQDIAAVRKHIRELLDAGVVGALCIPYSGGQKKEQHNPAVHRLQASQSPDHQGRLHPPEAGEHILSAQRLPVVLGPRSKIRLLPNRG